MTGSRRGQRTPSPRRAPPPSDPSDDEVEPVASGWAPRAGPAIDRRHAGPTVRARPLRTPRGASDGDAAGNLAFDAQIVAICREGGVSELLTEDRDFDRFRGFRTVRL